jgi:hypothetical protein
MMKLAFGQELRFLKTIIQASDFAKAANNGISLKYLPEIKFSETPWRSYIVFCTGNSNVHNALQHICIGNVAE